MRDKEAPEGYEYYPSAITSGMTDIGEEGKDWEWKLRPIKPKGVDVERLAEKHKQELIMGGFANKNDANFEKLGFKIGYKQALQDTGKKFSLEDMEKAFHRGYENGADKGEYISFANFIQSLTKA